MPSGAVEIGETKSSYRGTEACNVRPAFRIASSARATSHRQVGRAAAKRESSLVQVKGGGFNIDLRLFVRTSASRHGRASGTQGAPRSDGRYRGA